MTRLTSEREKYLRDLLKCEIKLWANCMTNPLKEVFAEIDALRSQMKIDKTLTEGILLGADHTRKERDLLFDALYKIHGRLSSMSHHWSTPDCECTRCIAGKALSAIGRDLT